MQNIGLDDQSTSRIRSLVQTETLCPNLNHQDDYCAKDSISLRE